MYNYRKIDRSRCAFATIGADEEVPDGKRIFVEIDGIQIVVFRVGGELFAIA